MGALPPTPNGSGIGIYVASDPCIAEGSQNLCECTRRHCVDSIINLALKVNPFDDEFQTFLTMTVT